MVGMCQPELEKRFIINSDRFDTYPKAKAAIIYYVDQMRYKSDPMDIGDMVFPAEDEYAGEWKGAQAHRRGALRRRDIEPSSMRSTHTLTTRTRAQTGRGVKLHKKGNTLIMRAIDLDVLSRGSECMHDKFRKTEQRRLTPSQCEGGSPCNW